MKRLGLKVLGLSVSLLLAGVTQLDAGAIFLRLGTLPGGEDGATSLANAVSADGRFVVGVSDGAVKDQAFIWSASTGS